MRQRQLGGPKLPKELRDRLGDSAHRAKNSRGRNPSLNRKDRRKADRSDRKLQKKRSHEWNGDRWNQLEIEKDEEITEQEAPLPNPTPSSPLKSILKKTEPITSLEIDREPSPPTPHIPRVVKDRLAKDDAEIAALEKKLGIRSKHSKAGIDDGLEDLFGNVSASNSDEEVEGKRLSKRKRVEDENWLASKRRKALGEQVESSSDEEANFDELEHSEAEEYVDMEDDEEEEEEAFESFDSDEEVDGNKIEPAQPRIRENPYVAPVSSDTPQPPKYIPPALRVLPSSDAESLARLKRRVQGLLNRLSDANILTILRDIEQIYQANARGYVTTTLVDLLIGLLADETILPDTFLILHAGFIATIYKVVGTDFGAQMVEQIVSSFDTHYEQNKSGSGKHTTNLVSVIAELYTFQVIGSNLIFDYIKKSLDELSEINTELLLRIVKISGSQLRQDDPTSLKDIVLLLQKSVTKIGEGNLPVRTKFMIETINNLKNNRMKTGVAASAILSEHTTRMRKHLGSLNARNLKGTEPLRIGLADIQNTDKRGKWWLVGASWRNDTVESNAPAKSRSESRTEEPNSLGLTESGDIDLLQLAREQRTNTDVRRAIFVTIMSATDFKDAHMRLLKLNLKRAQEMEIPRVIVRCAGAEQNYNPYYTLLARRFCSDHKLRKSFQFVLWDTFKSLGERRDGDGDAASDEDDGENSTAKEDLSLRRLVNLGKLYGTLIARSGLPITSLKALNFPYLKPKTKTFVEIMLVTVIQQTQLQGAKGGGGGTSRNEKGLLEVFVNADAAPGMIAGLQFFLRKVVARTDIVDEADKATVKWACRAIVEMLTRLSATFKLDDDDGD